MKIYFERALSEIKEDAIKRYPEEACGLIVEDEYIPCDNVAESPETDFKIRPEEYIYHSKRAVIQAIVHSHNDFPHASKKDMQAQIATAVPWGVVNVKNKNVMGVFFWGDQLEMQDLLKRPFCHGVYDCYSLVRDYYRQQSIMLPECPREWKWWENGEDLYMTGLEEAGFVRIDRDELEEGDGILFQVRSKVINHSAIYLGRGLMLHHLVNRLSRREPVGSWVKFATHFVRYNG